MPIAWFLCPYRRRLTLPRTRYCAMDDFTALIRADGGDWAETEILGDIAIVKVRANLATLAAVAVAPRFRRLPKDRLDAPLSDLTQAQKDALRDELIAVGYAPQEILGALGADIGTKTFRDVLRFAATRRLKPRYNAITNTIILDGPAQPCRSVESVDAEIV